MTPNELLEEAKSHFVVLYHKDDTVLVKLLKKALGTFQEKAGSIGSLKIEDGETTVDLPSDFLDYMSASDASGNFIDASYDNREITVITSDTTKYPITVSYFHNLRDWSLDVDLPHGCVNTVLDYLIALIEVPNTDRERAAAAATGLTVELPSKQELKDRVSTLEQAMEETCSLASPTIVK